jgi:feruloyl esterase
MSMRKRTAIIAAISLGAGFLGLAPHLQPSPFPVAKAVAALPRTAQPGECSALAGIGLPNVEILRAEAVPEGAPVAGAGLQPMIGPSATVARGLPAFCRVAGRIRLEPGSEIGFEVWMPAAPQWDGRMHGVGIGGFAGGIDYITLGLAVKAGQAGVATDTGHSGKIDGYNGTMMDSSWAKGHPVRIRDYGWRAVHLSTVTAKRLIAAYYGRGPDKSYFVGCSGGGRQGLMEAARYPGDYDGILAGAPAARLTDVAMAMANTVQAQLPPGEQIRPQQARLLQEETIRQCDALDGQADGLIADPRQCHFDASKLACGTSSSPLCFSPAQIAAVQRIHAGARNSRGRQVVAGYLPAGSEAGDGIPGWPLFILAGPNGVRGGETLANGFIVDFVQKPFTTPARFDFNRDPARLKAELAYDLDAPTDLRRFFARGGKLILWQGWADQAIPPEQTLAWRDEMLRRSGALAARSSRLFMLPGVQHCSGGMGPNSFGQGRAPRHDESPDRHIVATLQAWVEGARPAPESLIAGHGHGGIMGLPDPPSSRQGLLCAWPKRAVLTPGQDPQKISNYSCR